MKSKFIKSTYLKLICFSTLFFQVLSPLLSASYIPTPHSIEYIAQEKTIDQLLLLMQKRLIIMHEVARTKWNQALPIEDKVREQQIIDALVEKAHPLGVDKKWVSEFFNAQIEAAKEVQYNDFAFWKQEKVLRFEKVLSLKDELRAYIDQINQEMIELLSKLIEKNHNDNISMFEFPLSASAANYIDNDIWLKVVLPLKEILQSFEVYSR